MQDGKYMVKLEDGTKKELAELSQPEFDKLIEQQKTGPKTLEEIAFAQLDDWVTSRISDDAPFTLTLKSAITNASAKFNFSALQHFKNWLKAIENGSVISDSSNYSQYSDVVSAKDVFQYFIPSISVASGGCNTHEKETLKKETPYHTFTLYNPQTKFSTNNCGFKVLEKILSVKLEYCELRKTFNIEKDAKLTPEQITKIYKSLLTTTNAPLVFIDENFSSTINKNYEYIFMQNGHYYYVTNAVYKGLKGKTLTKKSFFDFLTDINLEDLYGKKQTTNNKDVK
jgi:hypothetical protein